MANNSEFYRGKKKKTGPALIIVVVLLCLIALALLVFYGLQKYLVITNNGVYLDAPLLGTSRSQVVQDDSQAKQFEAVQAELIVGDPDYTNVKASAGENLKALKGRLVPFDMISSDSLLSYADDMGDADTLILDAKTTSGMLAWKSNVEIAKGYGTTGSMDLKAAVTKLKEKDVRVAVRLCCFVDDTLATRYKQLALKTSEGVEFSDDNGAWLDPSNPLVTGYIIDLCKELDSMGVDEIILNGMRLPEAEGVSFAYSSTTSAEPTPQTIISGTAIKLTRALSTVKSNVSVQVGSDAAMTGVDNLTGQSAELFFKVFDRIYRTSSADTAADEQEAAKDKITLGDIKFRYVPMCYEEMPDTTCWVNMG